MKFNIATSENLNQLIDSSLEKVGKYANADRAYLFRYSKDFILMHNTHEWVREGIPSEKEFYSSFDSSKLGWLNDQLLKKQVVSIPDTELLPEEADEAKYYIQNASGTSGAIKSLVCSPIVFSNRVVGFVGFDSVIKNSEWSEIDSKILQFVGQIFINAIQRTDEAVKLKQVKDSLNNVIDSMPSILIGVNSNCNVTLWNKAIEDFTGINSEIAKGKYLTEVFPGIIPELEIIKNSIKYGSIKQNTMKSLKVGENLFYSELTIFPLISNKIHGAVIRIDDVTEKMQMKELMIQSEKMLSVGGLAAGMAHEINNPLAGMIQTANVLANRLGKKDNIAQNKKAAETAGTTMKVIQDYMELRDITRLIESINISGERIANIITNMLNFARKSDGEKTSQSIAEIINRTVNLASTDYDLKKQYDFKKIRIEKEYEENIPQIPCESAKIEQVILNIFRNGAQAMDAARTENPQFTIRVKLISDNKMVSIEIEDNGPGIDEMTRSRIFEPFFTTKPEGEGTGLGLSVSYFIITENHHGDLIVHSEPGKGANFIIQLPIG